MRWPWNSPAPSPRDHLGTPLPRPWWRRNWPVLAIVAVLILGAGVWKWSPWTQCGRGLSPDGQNGQTCVGLDLDSSSLVTTGSDPLNRLETTLRNDNANVSGTNVATIVYLDDMEPDPAYDTVSPAVLKHRVEGVITAQRYENDPAADNPKIRVLLANYGSNANDWQKAVTEIEANAKSLNIVAVTGFGQSLSHTKSAIENLSAHHIFTVGSVTSGDDMNIGSNGKPIQNFYRVTSANKDEANVAASYIGQRYKRIMLVQDDDQSDQYTSNLGSDFAAAELKKGYSITHYESYSSEPGPPNGANRSQAMTYQFRQYMGSDICSYQPDLIYFAGRGADLYSFLAALGEDKSCGLHGPVDVISGDDMNTAIDTTKWPSLNGITVHVYYTAVATENEWRNVGEENSFDAQGYNTFAGWFHQADFHSSELVDGHAIMEYDALLTAATVVQRYPYTVNNTGYLDGGFRNLTCEKTKSIPGASGRIAFYRNGTAIDRQGNPIDKPLPIMELNSKGSATQKGLEWSDGESFDARCGS